jgi:hypothetical protein
LEHFDGRIAISPTNPSTQKHSYYWRRGGYLKASKTEASPRPLPTHPALKNALLEWRGRSLYATFVMPLSSVSVYDQTFLVVMSGHALEAMKSAPMMGICAGFENRNWNWSSESRA